MEESNAATQARIEQQRGTKQKQEVDSMEIFDVSDIAERLDEVCDYLEEEEERQVDSDLTETNINA